MSSFSRGVEDMYRPSHTLQYNLPRDSQETTSPLYLGPCPHLRHRRRLETVVIS